MMKNMKTYHWMIVVCVVLVAVLIGIGTVLVQNGNLNARADSTAKQLAATNKVITTLQAQAREKECQVKNDRLAFGLLLYSFADNFSTPPYPDPARVNAVNKMRALGDRFSAPTPVPSTTSCSTNTPATQK